MNSLPTMQELYPEGRGYHDAHEPYLSAVADALAANGFPVAGWHADANDPRDGAIELDLDLKAQGTIDGKPIWSHDEVWVCWQEERGWWLLTVDEFEEPVERGDGNWQTDSRYVYYFTAATIASPSTVVLEVAERAGLTLELDDDGHPDADFPDHEFGEDNIPLELALRRYAEATSE